MIATVSVIFSSGPKFYCLFQRKMLSLFLLFLCRSIDDFHKILIVVKREYKQVMKVTLSLRFNGHFPGEPGLAGVY